MISNPPRGFFRRLARLPIWLYRLRAGWLLGSRFLLLEHRGRKTGQPRHAVLEVVGHDRTGRAYSVAAPWGRRAQWVNNVLATPDVTITVGNRNFRATAKMLSPEKSEKMLRRYGRRHRIAATVLARLLAGSTFEAIAKTVRVVEFRPRHGPSESGRAHRKYSAEPLDAKAFSRSHDRAYTRFARIYDLAVKLLPVWKAWLRRALPHVHGPRVLEVSFGTGYLMTQYAGRFETHGLELNEQMVKAAGRNLKSSRLSAQLVRGDVHALPYPDSSFDSVLNTMAFSAYPNGRTAMSELTRVLKPGGRLVLIDVDYPADGNWVGTRLASAWKLTGDLLRDVEKLMRESALDVAHKEIGGWGSVHLYVARKEQ